MAVPVRAGHQTHPCLVQTVHQQPLGRHTHVQGNVRPVPKHSVIIYKIASIINKYNIFDEVLYETM